MKKIILIIITLFTLTNSYIKSADWISNNLPQRWYVEPKWRNQVKLIQEKTGTSVPIIFYNCNMKAQACTLNIGMGPFRFAIMTLNQTKLASEAPALQTRILAHETVHIDKNHGGRLNSYALVGAPLLLGISKLGRYFQSPLIEGSAGLAAIALSLAAILYKFSPYETRDIIKSEFEAEEESFEKLKQLNYRNTLKELLEYYKTNKKQYDSHYFQANSKNISQRTYQENTMLNYPSYEQLEKWADYAYERCPEGSAQPIL